ncbi:hypothetical protein L3C95_30260 [Chitinophaga filiformis]|uniref:hypothetical protein n=1 Tax=Chitinophaga filiformis TaxID=104663 RepID=UPI001F40A10C|nr:hypothetical protein [Chitinophaga filiformis]MCF6407219.1 hypothetical protein [Chitinophaga filiformis]
MTIKDLLYKVLDYRYEWAAKELNNSEPARIRIAQIKALAQAFGLFSNEDAKKFAKDDYVTNAKVIEYIVVGHFLHVQSFEKVHPLVKEKILAFTKQHYPSVHDARPLRFGDIRWLFNDLFIYRQKLYEVTYPFGGMLEGFSAGLYYGRSLQHELNDIIEKNISEIDETLAMILDPEMRQLDALPQGYPDADLDSIDHDWLMENL